MQKQLKSLKQRAVNSKMRERNEVTEKPFAYERKLKVNSPPKIRDSPQKIKETVDEEEQQPLSKQSENLDQKFKQIDFNREVDM